MKIAFYPGSFNPFHEGHQNVLDKALTIFDKVILLQLTHPDKIGFEKLKYRHIVDGIKLSLDNRLKIISSHGASLQKVAGTYILGHHEGNQFAVIRSIRNEKDFCEEQILQYNYEDMGIKMPIFYIIADRSLVHVSSSAKREIKHYLEKI